jgi:hypothetical protein
MRIYRTLAALGLAVGIFSWLLDVASAQQRVQHQKRQFTPQPAQPAQPVQPFQPVQRRTVTPVVPIPPRFAKPATTAPINNPGNPVIGGQIIQSPSAGITPIQGMSNGYLGSLANNNYLGGFANGNLFLNPNLGFGNSFFGTPWGNPWTSTWGNPWTNSWGSPWGFNQFTTFGNPWGSPFNQFGLGNAWSSPFSQFGNPWNPALNPYGAMNLWNANPFQMGLQNPFANPFLQQPNPFLGLGNFNNNNGQLVGQQPR